MLEKTLSQKIVASGNKIPHTRLRKRHAGPWRKGLADITGASQGRHVEIEVKLPGNKPTKIQLIWLEKWAKTLAITGIAYSEEQAEQILLDGLHGIIAPPEKYREMLNKGQYQESKKN